MYTIVFYLIPNFRISKCEVGRPNLFAYVIMNCSCQINPFADTDGLDTLTNMKL